VNRRVFWLTAKEASLKTVGETVFVRVNRRQAPRLLVRDRTEHEIQRARDPTRRPAAVGDVLMVRIVAALKNTCQLSRGDQSMRAVSVRRL